MVVPVLVGNDAILQYIEERWAIPRSTAKNYLKEMQMSRTILKRMMGKPPNRHLRTLALPERIDKFIEMKFSVF